MKSLDQFTDSQLPNNLNQNTQLRNSNADNPKN